jgi:hypothetical protein
VKIFERLIDKRGLKITPHDELEMPGSVDQRSPLKKQENAAHKIDAEDNERINNDLMERDLFAKIVDRNADVIRNEKPERHRNEDVKNTRDDLPFIRLYVF